MGESHPARALVLAAILAACGSEPAAAPSPPPPAARAPSAPAPVEVAPVLPPPHLAFAGDEAWPGIEIEQLPVRSQSITVGGLAWHIPQIAHPDRAVRTALDRELRSAIRTWMREGRVENASACDALLAHRALVSIACRGVDGYLAGVSLGPLQWAIEGSTLRPLRTEEVLIDGVDLDALHAERCRDCGQQQLAIGPYGLVQLSWDKLHEIPYPAIRAQLRPESVLAQVLPQAAPEGERSLHGWTVASFDGLADEMILWWAALDEDVRSSIDFVIAANGDAHAIVPDDHARGDALALAARFTPAERSGAPDPMVAVPLPRRIVRGRARSRLEVVRADARLELRVGPAARWDVRSVVPRGALGYTLAGDAIEGSSAPSRGWSYAIFPGAWAGWAAPRTLSPAASCDPAHIVEQTHSDVRFALRPYRTMLGTVELEPGQRRAFVVAQDGSREARIGIFELDEACRVGARVAVAAIEGTVTGVEITSLASRPWMLIETTPPGLPAGTRRWTALADWTRIAWTGDVPADRGDRVVVVASGDTLATIEGSDGTRTRLVVTGSELEERADAAAPVPQ